MRTSGRLRGARCAVILSLGLPIGAAFQDARAVGADCNGNGIDDRQDIAAETSLDCNGNDVPAECDLESTGGFEPEDR